MWISLTFFFPPQVPYFVAPDPKALPSIPENVSLRCIRVGYSPICSCLHYVCIALPTACVFVQRNLTELVLAVDVGNLLQLYASMLFERRILICCSKLSTVRRTACIKELYGAGFLNEPSLRAHGDELKLELIHTLLCFSQVGQLHIKS